MITIREDVFLFLANPKKMFLMFISMFFMPLPFILPVSRGFIPVGYMFFWLADCALEACFVRGDGFTVFVGYLFVIIIYMFILGLFIMILVDFLERKEGQVFPWFVVILVSAVIVTVSFMFPVIQIVGEETVVNMNIIEYISLHYLYF
ncbi:hypothetical protein GOV11_00760 [Candidatus Woesearchaeota archaeon]|nr:hypothetical protein [Candidatus Woesearchaeota archaeon]